MKKLVLKASVHSIVFTFIFLVLFPYLASRVRTFIPSFNLGIFRYLGVLLFILGGLLSLWCVVLFVVQGLGTPNPYSPPKKLVVSGPYRYIRNPMAFGVIVMLVGCVIFFQSFSILIYTILFIIGIHLFIICYEERRLSVLFGNVYREYKHDVSRWFPKISQFCKR